MRSFNDYLNEKMDPREHSVKRDGKFVVVDKDGKVVKTFDDKEAADKYAVANHDDLMEGCGCDGTNEDFKSRDAGRVGAKLYNRKDISPEDRKKAQRSLERKVATAKRKEGAHNVMADSGKRYRVGTKRPADPNNPKHKELVRSRAISRAMDKDRRAGYSTEAVRPALRMGVDFKYKAPSDAEKAAMKRERERAAKMRSTPDTSAAGRASQRMIDARKKTEESVELDELSPARLKKYNVRAIRDREDTVRRGYDPMAGRLDPKSEKRRKKRVSGIAKAKRKMATAEDVEQVDELRRDTLGSYADKAQGDIEGIGNVLKAKGKQGPVSAKHRAELERELRNRTKGRKTAIRKKYTREDAEQVDELKSSTLRSYLDKSRKQNQTRVTRMADQPSSVPADKGEMHKLRKRRKGSEAAASRLDARKHNLEPKLKREDVELDELKMPRGGLEKGTFKNPALMLKLLTTGGKGKRKRKVQEEKKDKIKIELDPKKKIGYEVRSVGPGGKTTVTKRRDMPGQEDVGEASAAWQRKEGKNKEGGLNAAGRRSYERENPGSDLKAPVSAEQAKKSKGGKAAKRRKSFCARMGGMPGPMKDEKGRPTRKALALRKWDC